MIAERSVDADALATVCNVLEPEESLRLVSVAARVECLIVTKDGQIVAERRLASIRTARPARCFRPRSRRAALGRRGPRWPKCRGAPDRRGAPWNQDFELVVNFEINQPDAQGRPVSSAVCRHLGRGQGRASRPQPLTLWVSMGGAGPFQWLPDLKRWYRADQDRKEVDKKDLFFTIARADPPAGQVQGHLGRQGRPWQAAWPAASTPS